MHRCTKIIRDRNEKTNIRKFLIREISVYLLFRNRQTFQDIAMIMQIFTSSTLVIMFLLSTKKPHGLTPTHSLFIYFSLLGRFQH